MGLFEDLKMIDEYSNVNSKEENDMATTTIEENVKKNDEGVTLENIKESDDISHNSSKCLGLSRAGSDNSVLVIDVIKNRSGKSGVKLRYEWDINSGYFSYLPSMTDSTPTDLTPAFLAA